MTIHENAFRWKFLGASWRRNGGGIHLWKKDILRHRDDNLFIIRLWILPTRNNIWAEVCFASKSEFFLYNMVYTFEFLSGFINSNLPWISVYAVLSLYFFCPAHTQTDQGTDCITRVQTEKRNWRSDRVSPWTNCINKGMKYMGRQKGLANVSVQRIPKIAKWVGDEWRLAQDVSNFGRLFKSTRTALLFVFAADWSLVIFRPLLRRCLTPPSHGFLLRQSIGWCWNFKANNT
jgi:hypothetical protein